jgi:hypothetical protein
MENKPAVIEKAAHSTLLEIHFLDRSQLQLICCATQPASLKDEAVVGDANFRRPVGKHRDHEQRDTDQGDADSSR